MPEETLTNLFALDDEIPFDLEDCEDATSKASSFQEA